MQTYNFALINTKTKDCEHLIEINSDSLQEAMDIAQQDLKVLESEYYTIIPIK